MPIAVEFYRFTGKERDTESGLDNFGARYNASTMGRFMTPDLVFISADRLTDPQSLNLYAYVRNNPLSLVDPTGLDFYLACQGRGEYELRIQLPEKVTTVRIIKTDDPCGIEGCARQRAHATVAPKLPWWAGATLL